MLENVPEGSAGERQLARCVHMHTHAAARVHTRKGSSTPVTFLLGSLLPPLPIHRHPSWGPAGPV